MFLYEYWDHQVRLFLVTGALIGDTLGERKREILFIIN